MICHFTKAKMLAYFFVSVLLITTTHGCSPARKLDSIVGTYHGMETIRVNKETAALQKAVISADGTFEMNGLLGKAADLHSSSTVVEFGSENTTLEAIGLPKTSSGTYALRLNRTSADEFKLTGSPAFALKYQRDVLTPMKS